MHLITNTPLFLPKLAVLVQISALEISSDCSLILNEFLAEMVGSDESYVHKPTLISEAHGVEVGSGNG